MPNEVDKAPTVAVNNKYYVLIPSRFPTIKLYSRIAANNHDEFTAIETLTNPRVLEKERIKRGVGLVDDSAPSLQNWNHAPFMYSNPEGSHFFGPDRNCLELSDSLQTAVAVSVIKRQTFLARTSEAPTNLDMRVLARTVRGNFLDGRGWLSVLSEEDKLNLKQTMESKGLDGVLFSPLERPSGTCIAILNKDTLDRAIQADHYRYIWDGQRVSSIYSFTDGAEIDASNLVSAKNILAA